MSMNQQAAMLSSDSDDDDLILELAKFTQHNPKKELSSHDLNPSSTEDFAHGSSNNTNNTTLVSPDKPRASSLRYSVGYSTNVKAPPNKNEQKNSDLQVLLARGEIAVLRGKLKELELERERERLSFYNEKDNIIKKHEHDLDSMKQDINKLEDEKDFLKMQMKSASRMNNVVQKTEIKDHLLTSGASTMVPHSDLLYNTSTTTTTTSETGTGTETEHLDKKTKVSTTPKSDGPVFKKPVFAKQKKSDKIKINFQAKSQKIDENVMLLSKLLKHRIPGLKHTCIYYLEKMNGYNNFQDYAMNIVSELNLNKFIESLLDYYLKIINRILNGDNSSDNDTKYIPFVLSIILEIIKYRPSACDFDILVNLFILMKKVIVTFEYIFKSTTIDSTQSKQHLQKYFVRTIDDSKKSEEQKWKNLYPETEQLGFNSGTLTSNDSTVGGSANTTGGNYSGGIGPGAIGDDSLFELPTFQTEFVDIVIIVYSFDVLEVISKNLRFHVEVHDSQNIDMKKHSGDDSILMLSTKLFTLMDDVTYLYRLTYSISFQPIFQPIFNVSIIIENFLKSFNILFRNAALLNKSIKSYPIENGIDDNEIDTTFSTAMDPLSQQIYEKWNFIINDISEWLIQLNVNNILKTLPSKYNIHSLLRPIVVSDRTADLTVNLDKLMKDGVIYEPEKNKVFYIYFWNLNLTKQILDNVLVYLVFPKNSPLILATFQNEDLRGVLKNVIKLLAADYPLLLTQTGMDLALLNEILGKCLKIIQHCHYLSLNLHTRTPLSSSTSTTTSSNSNSHSSNKIGEHHIGSNNSITSGNSTLTSITSRSKSLDNSSGSTLDQTSILNDDQYKLELIVTLSRIVYQHDQRDHDSQSQSYILREICRDILDTLITPDESDYIYEALTPKLQEETPDYVEN